MNLKYEKLSLKVDEADVTRIFIKDNLKLRNSLKSLHYWIYIICFLFINYYLLLNYVVLNFRDDVLLNNDHWLEIKKNDKKNCLTKSALNQSTLSTFKEMIEYFNQKCDFNYFMCFSSLYYAVKVEAYDVYSSNFEDNSNDYKNSIYMSKSLDKCVHQEFFSNVSERSLKKTRLHLCFLSTFLKEKSLCDVVRKFESLYNKGIDCKYNHMTGEYMIILGEEIHLIFHEFNIGFNFLRFLSDSLFSHQIKTDMDTELFEEYTSLNRGLMGKFFPNQYFSLPRHFFYSKFYTSEVKSNFVHYLGAPIRLPSEIINYFMLFYSSIWYI